MRVFLKLIFGIIIIVSLLAFCTVIFESFLTSETVEIKVMKLETKIDPSSNKKEYFIHSQNEIFRNENSYYHGKSNQDALMKIFKEKKTYKVHVVGYQIGFEIPFIISKYRNIVKIAQ